jgi:hypothetical protein
MAVHVPPAWPPSVRPPGAEDWVVTAVAWLVEQGPDLRDHELVRRHPLVMASITRHSLEGAVEGLRRGYRTVRTDLGEAVPPHVVDAALAAYKDEGRQLAARARAAAAIEDALRSEFARSS